MEFARKAILPNVSLTCLRTDKFKTGCLSITLLTQLNREDAAKNAVLPQVLRRGTRMYPDMEKLSAALDELYGARLEPVVRKKGELQCLGFYADFVDEPYLPNSEPLLEKVIELMGEVLLNPNTRGGLLLPQYVDSERENLIERIRSVINDKTAYSLERLRELMCFGEDYAIGANGTVEMAESISYQKLTRHYRRLLAESPIEVFYCGSAELWRVERALKDVLATLPRGAVDPNLGTDIRQNAVEEEPRIFGEELDVTQGKLAIGFRLGESMHDRDGYPDLPVLRVFNAIYGGSLTSKLFTNVRERLSLCYFASSMLDRHKGVVFVCSGIEFSKYDEAKNEILAQLEAIRNGEITDAELEGARQYVATALKSSLDEPSSLEDFWLSQNIDGFDYGPDYLAELCLSVTAEQVVRLAKEIECDAIYFLSGSGEVQEA